MYVDAVGGDPLFSTMDQFDAGDGWPAFRRPLREWLLRREADLSTTPPRIRLRKGGLARLCRPARALGPGVLNQAYFKGLPSPACS
ncbi:peptide-methionine (R)-S-oxide reductase [Paenibacillus sp. D51F]